MVDGNFGVPCVSSAALTLRSQRTDTRDPSPGSTTPLSEQANFSATAPDLRPYQIASVTSVEAQYRDGVKRTLLVLPTGCGKTIVFAELARRINERNGARALVLAHRTELIDQAAEKVQAVGLTVSIEQGSSRGSLVTDVIVASVQTLQRERLLRFAADAFDFIVIDEAHHAPAASYQAILDHFPNALVLGVTATPQRADGKALGKIFTTVAFAYELRQAIADQWLVPIVARRVRITDVDMSAIKAHHGDLAQDELSAVLRDAKALQGVVGPLVQLVGSRKTLVFAVDVAHAKALTEKLNEHRQGAAIVLDGSAPKAQRKAVLQLFRKGTFQFLVNCALFTEGFDDPSIQCVALARPTMSVGLYIQMVGRGTRLLGLSYSASIANGKRDVLLLDFVGNTRHRLATPADALAGALLPEAANDNVNAQLDSGKPADLELVLSTAEREAAEAIRKKAQLALAHYREHEVNPFLGDFMPPLDESNPAFHKPATDGQLAAIEKWGISKAPDGLTLGEASRMIDALVERDKRGLASMKQCQLLRKFKLDCSTMTKQRATQLVIQGKTRGFREYTYIHEPEYRARRKAS